MSNKQRVFISYSFNDKETADKIVERLRKEDITVVSDIDNIQAGQSYFEEIKYLYETSEIIIILLSDSLFRNEKFQFEFPRFFFDEARKRKVTIIPALVDKCTIPSDFLEFEIINLKTNFNKGLDKIVERLKVFQEISFENFSPHVFEEFVYDLLKEYGFRNLERVTSNGKGIDFLGEYYSTNPFGIKKRETWLVEVKYYKEERFSISAIRNIVEAYKYIGKEDAKILLVTNGLLTSAAEEYIDEVRRYSNIDIDLLDGQTLKKLVSRRKRLLDKHFLKK